MQWPLIVAGGNGGQAQLLATVEVLDTDTWQWYIHHEFSTV